MNLEEKVKLMEKYDFSKFSYGLSEDGSEYYPHGFGNCVSTILVITENIERGLNKDKDSLLKSIAYINEVYGFMRSCYDSVDFNLIAQDSDFDMLRKINELLPELGKSIHKLTFFLAKSGYVSNKEVKDSAKDVKNFIGSKMRLGYDKYRQRLNELQEQLEKRKNVS